jgi:hypothetical protein
MIRIERLRQITDEGFTHEHDDGYPAGTLQAAADCYLFLTGAIEAPDDMRGCFWPWNPRWFKPSIDRSRNLIKAGALYVAEAERYERNKRPDLAERMRDMVLKIAVEVEEEMRR